MSTSLPPSPDQSVFLGEKRTADQMQQGATTAEPPQKKQKIASPEEELRAIFKELERVEQTPMEFCVNGVTKNDFSVEVTGVDKMPESYPWSEDFIKEKLVPFAEKAPYGKDDQTVIDEDVRKTLQIDASKFKLGDGFKNATSKMMENIALALAPNIAATELTLTPYKLLIYETGGFFKPHRDTARGDTHFGSVTIVLPTKHKGGKLLVRHGDTSKEFDFAKSKAAKKFQWVAFYASEEHEVEPITAGYRVCLTFHLFRPADKTIAKPLHNPLEHPLIKRLKDVAAMDGSPNCVGTFLSYKYAGASVQPKNLKAEDGAMYQLLSSAFPARVFPVEVEIGGYSHDDGEPGSIKYIDVDSIEDPNIEISEQNFTGAKSKKSPPSRIVWTEGDVSRNYEEANHINMMVQTDMLGEVRRMRRTEKRISGSGNEGSDAHFRYVTAVLAVWLKQDDYSEWGEFSTEHTNRRREYYGV